MNLDLRFSLANNNDVSVYWENVYASHVNCYLLTATAMF